MPACTNSATRGRSGLAAPAILAAVLHAATSAAWCAQAPATAADLRKILEEAEKALDKTEGALRGKDAGRVSLLLKRADDEIALFEDSSGLAALVRALADGRSAAKSDNLEGAGEAVQRARALTPMLADYTVTRQAEEASRAALGAARKGEAAVFLEALERFEGAILPSVLQARIDEARKAIARGRSAMVRRDMKAGAAEVETATRSINGLRYAAALSRARFAMTIGSELLAERAILAARDQIQKALGDLEVAIDLAPEERRAALQESRGAAKEIWRRIQRPLQGDPEKLEEIGRTIEELRKRQG
jgi:hypothetical protein